MNTVFALAGSGGGTPVDLGPLTTRVTALEAKPAVDLGPLTSRVAAVEAAPLKPHKHAVGTTDTSVI